MATAAIIGASALLYGGYEKNKAKKQAEKIESHAKQSRLTATQKRKEEEDKIAATKKRLTSQRTRLFETEGGVGGSTRGTIFGN